MRRRVARLAPLLAVGAALVAACAQSAAHEPITNVLDLRARGSAPLGAYWVLEHGHPPKAVYDEEGRHVSGRVRLEFTVDSNGRVRAVRIVGEEPNRLLGRTVSDAMKKWHYAPTPENAERRPVRVSVSFTMGSAR